MNYCPKCGFSVENMKFCPKCGFELKESSEVTASDVEFVPEELSEASIERVHVKNEGTTNEHSREDEIRNLRSELVGEKAYHYVPIFEDLDKNGGQSWNWCGCLFAPMWFAYRKLYSWAAIAIIGPGIVSVILGLALVAVSAGEGAVNFFSRGLGIAFAILFGVISNSIYKKRIDKLITEMPFSEDEKTKYIKNKGGVSGIGLVVALIVYIGYILLPMFIAE